MTQTIRSAAPFDAHAISAIYAPFVSDNVTSFELDPPDAADVERRILELQAQYPWLVFEADGRVLGYAYASAHRSRKAYQWSTDVSVYIHPDGHRRGIGRALYTALFEVLRRQGYVNAYAGITLPNAASVGLHEAMGFVPVGVYQRVGFKLGAWHDVVWLQLRLADPPVPVPVPVPALDVLAGEGLTRMFRDQAGTVRRDR